MTQSHSDPTSPAAIAIRLTPRQREALLWLPADGSGRLLQYTSGPNDLVRPGLVLVSLLLTGRTSYRLTPLGIRVRAAVEAGDGT